LCIFYTRKKNREREKEKRIIRREAKGTSFPLFKGP
jgi:hypothetical protein